jgi:hypothetical protein
VTAPSTEPAMIPAKRDSYCVGLRDTTGREVLDEDAIVGFEVDGVCIGGDAVDQVVSLYRIWERGIRVIYWQLQVGAPKRTLMEHHFPYK